MMSPMYPRPVSVSQLGTQLCFVCTPLPPPSRWEANHRCHVVSPSVFPSVGLTCRLGI